MPNLYHAHNYRDFLNELVLERAAKGLTRVELSKAIGCQAAYLSQVLSGRAELTEDHGVRLCLFLEFAELETEYFLLLLREARAGTQALRTYLIKKREVILADLNDVSSRVSSKKKSGIEEASIYYCSSWLPSAIHVATSCERFQSVKEIAHRLGTPEDIVKENLLKLERFGLVRFEDGRWIYEGTSFHFPKNSALDVQFQTTRRLMAIESLPKAGRNDLHYSVVFSTDQKTYSKIKELCLDQISKIHKLVEPTPGEDVYGVCIDLFRA